MKLIKDWFCPDLLPFSNTDMFFKKDIFVQENGNMGKAGIH